MGQGFPAHLGVANPEPPSRSLKRLNLGLHRNRALSLSTVSTQSLPWSPGLSCSKPLGRNP
jgi:hypothetical protein